MESLAFLDKSTQGMSLGLHSFLFPTKMKAAAKEGGVRGESGTETETAADMTCNFALFASDSHTLTKRLGGSSCSAALLSCINWGLLAS